MLFLSRTALAAAVTAAAAVVSTSTPIAAAAAPRPVARFSCAAALTATPVWEPTPSTTAVALELVLTNTGTVVGAAVPWTLGLGGSKEEEEGGGGGAPHAAPLGRPLALFDLEAPSTSGSDGHAASPLTLTATHFWQALPPGASTTASLIVEVPAEDVAGLGTALAATPGGVTINGVPCAVEVVGGPENEQQQQQQQQPGGEDATSAAAASPAPALDLSTAASPAPALDLSAAPAPASSSSTSTSQRAEVEVGASTSFPRAPRALTTRGGQLINVATGAPVFLAGVNWFGFDTPGGGTTMVDGLYAGGTGLTGDLSTVVYRLQLLGFNTIRLPFSMKSLFEVQPRGVARYGCAAASPRTVVAATAPPGTPAALLARAPPPSRAFAPSPPGTCSAYVPSHGTVLDRFAWTVDFFVRNGFYVIADYQLNTDASAIEDTSKWTWRWAELARKLVSTYPATAGRVILDIINEPDAVGMAWQPRDGKPAAGDLYLAAMDAVSAVWDGFVMLVEGCGQSGLARNWGDGFCTDRGVLSSRGLSDPTPFLSALVGRRYVNQVALAPHVYPPSISQATDEASGPGLWWRLSTSFGYLNRAGFMGHRFPIILGETGSAFTDDRDLAPQLDLVRWALLQGGGNDGRHDKVAGIVLWAWNGNAGSGHGLVDGGWSNLDHNKVAFAAAAGAVPWYARAGGARVRPVSIRRTGMEDGDGDGGGGGADTAAVPQPTCPVCPACGYGNTTTSTDASPASPPPPFQPRLRPGALATPAGEPFTLRAVSWAGFDTPAATLEGLDGEGLEASISRLAALGFNGVKLPVGLGGLMKKDGGSGEGKGGSGPACVGSPPPPTAALADATRPPGTAFAAFSQWVTYPAVGVEANPQADSAPAIAAAAALLCGGKEESAAAATPTPPGLARLAAVAAALAQAGLAVILEDADRASPATTDPAAWVGAWAAVAGAVSKSMDAAAVAGAVSKSMDAAAVGGAVSESMDAAAVGGDATQPLLGVRLLANPDALGLAWDADAHAEKDASSSPSLGRLYLAGADAVSASAPGAWVMLAGAGDPALPGAAFPSTSPGVASLLSELGARPYARRVVISPSLDSPKAGQQASAFTAAFGHLGARFPLVLGSTGADLGDATAAGGLADAIAALAPGCGLPACSRPGTGHAWPVSGWVWGAWVAGGKEGGVGQTTPILMASPADAAAPSPATQPLAESGAAVPAPSPAPPLPSIAWPAIALLSEGLGLAPWYLPPTVHRRAGGWSGPLPPGVAAEPEPEADSASASAPAPRPADSSGLYSATGGEATGAPAPDPASPPPTCRAVVRVAATGPSATAGAAAPAGLLLVRLANTRTSGPALSPPYRVDVAGPYAALLQGAGMEGGGVVGEEGGGEGERALTGLVTADTATLWPGGTSSPNEVGLALAVRGQPGAASLAPSGVSINGAPCRLESVASAEGDGGEAAADGPLVVVSSPRRSVS